MSQRAMGTASAASNRLEATKEVNQKRIDMSRRLLLEPMPHMRHNVRATMMWCQPGYGVNDVRHARYRQPGVTLADKEKRRDFQCPPLERRLQFPVPIKIAVVIQSPSKPRV